MVSRDEIRALRKILLEKIEDLYLKIYGRDPDGLITLEQLDPQTIAELRKVGDFYRRGERLPLSAIPDDFVLTSQMMPYVRGIINNTIYARNIVDEVVAARETEDTLLLNLNENYLQIVDLVDEINLAATKINLTQIDAALVEEDAVIGAINSSSEGATIDADRISTSDISGVVPIGSSIEYYGATEPVDGNWKFPNGQQLLIATYPDAAPMFAGVGTPDPDFFCLPDERGKVMVMVKEGDADFGIIHHSDGAKTHQLNVGETAKHNHAQVGTVSGTTSYIPPVMVQNDEAGTHEVYNSAPVSVGGDTADAGNDEAHNNLQPYYVVNKLIRVR